MSDSLILISPEGKIIEVNNAAMTLLGYAREEITGSPAEALLPEGGSIPGEGPPGENRIFLRTKKGENIPVSFQCRG